MDNDILNIHKLPDEPEASPDTLIHLSCERFVAEIAGKNPFPGSGSASAFVGAVAIALGNMAGSLIFDNDQYKDIKNEILELKFDADVLQADFIWLVSRNAEVAISLKKAYSSGENTGNDNISAALNSSAEASLQIMQKCAEAIPVIRALGEKGNSTTLSLAGSAAILVVSAMKAAVLDVFSSTALMGESSLAAELESEARTYLSEAENGEIFYDDVFAKLCHQ